MLALGCAPTAQVSEAWSTKTCSESVCGLNDVGASESREYLCVHCGLTADRDAHWQAAKNILAYNLRVSLLLKLRPELRHAALKAERAAVLSCASASAAANAGPAPGPGAATLSSA